MKTGSVIWYNAKKGIGFLKPDEDAADVFIHMRALKASGIKQVKEGDHLGYILAADPETGREAAAEIQRIPDADAAVLKSNAPAPAPKVDKSREPDVDASAFGKLGLEAGLVRSLGFQGYTDPTPIQKQAIPIVLAGRDLVGLAQTGTGKTAAFALPILQKLLLNPIELKNRSAQVLILSPTRELALQIHKSFATYGKRLPLKFEAAIGGVPIRKQMRALDKGVDVLVATPGRLEDLVQQKAVRLDLTHTIVLDEADQMMDIGFLPAIRRILDLIGAKRQTLLFSATMPKAIAELSTDYLTDPAQVAVTPESTTVEKIDQKLMHLTKQNKGLALQELATRNPEKRIIVFARTKHGSDKLVKWLATQGTKADAIHGNKSQGQRQRALEDFRKGKTYMLIATDIAARGIDIPGIELVINYDLPNVPEAYVHRIGRTARAGASGRAISFCAPDEQKLLRDIEKTIKMDVPIAHLDGLTEVVIPRAEKPAPRGGNRRNPSPRRAGGGQGGKPANKNKGKPRRGGKPGGQRKSR